MISKWEYMPVLSLRLDEVSIVPGLLSQVILAGVVYKFQQNLTSATIRGV